MICPKCKNEGILNSANFQEFYYCRTCKDEIKLDEVIKVDFSTSSKPLTQDEIDDLFTQFNTSGGWAP